MSTEAQKKASSTYRSRHKGEERYRTMVWKAKTFILAKENTKAGQAINNGDPTEYYNDLRDLQLMLEERISELKK